MKSKRPTTLTLAAIMLVITLLLSLALPLLSGLRVLRGGLPQPSSDGSQTSSPPGGMPFRPGRLLRGPFTSSSPNSGGVVGIALLGANALGGIAALIAAFGLWRCKKWGLILALAVAVLGIVSALPGLVGGIRFLPLVLPSLLRIALLTAVSVLVLLPSALDAYQ